MKFQVEATFSGHGYLTVEAADKDEAARKIRALDVRFSFAPFSEVDTTLFDDGPDIHIDNIVKDED